MINLVFVLVYVFTGFFTSFLIFKIVQEDVNKEGNPQLFVLVTVVWPLFLMFLLAALCAEFIALKFKKMREEKK